MPAALVEITIHHPWHAGHHTAENTVQTLNTVNDGLRNTTETMRAVTADIQQNTNVGEEARAAAKEAAGIDKANLEMTRQMKNTRLQTGGTVSYAAMSASGPVLAGTPNKQVHREPPVQTQREVVVTIGNAKLHTELAGDEPRSLTAHVERAIAQSGNENIAIIKVLSRTRSQHQDSH